MEFEEVVVRKCSSGHVIWDVVFRDGIEDSFHFGLWPNWLTETQRNQLRKTS